MKRYSKKRQSILELLRETYSHPTAEWVYDKLKPMYPHISLATVYRNLNDLKREGMIMTVGIVGDKERFDGRTDRHAHAVCEKCGRIIDVEGIDIPEDLLSEAQKLTGFTLKNTKIQFTGICEDCLKGEKNGD